LYPTGAGSEFILAFQALPYFQQISEVYYYLLICVMALYLPRNFLLFLFDFLFFSVVILLFSNLNPFFFLSLPSQFSLPIPIFPYDFSKKESSRNIKTKEKLINNFFFTFIIRFFFFFFFFFFFLLLFFFFFFFFFFQKTRIHPHLKFLNFRTNSEYALQNGFRLKEKMKKMK